MCLRGAQRCLRGSFELPWALHIGSLGCLRTAQGPNGGWSVLELPSFVVPVVVALNVL
jgi:hypothetical protein